MRYRNTKGPCAPFSRARFKHHANPVTGGCRLRVPMPRAPLQDVTVMVSERRNVREKRSPAAAGSTASFATSLRHVGLVAALGALEVLGTLAAGLSASSQARAADAVSERADLAAIVRELNLIDRLAVNAEAVAPGKSRYHFDYPRFHADITRARAGIQDYLNPPRAQPRDPAALRGAYRQETPSP